MCNVTIEPSRRSNTCEYIYVYVYIYIQIQIYIDIYIYICICVYVYMYVCMYIHIYIYRYIYLWWFERCVSYSRVSLSAEGAKNVSWPRLSPLQGWGSPTMAFTGKFVCKWLTISSCYGLIPLTLVLIGRDCGLSTLYHSCGFDYQQRMLKSFPGPGHLCFKDDGIV